MKTDDKLKEEIKEEDFMTLKEDDICVRCKKNKAILIYTNSQMDFIHGFTENICQECYDKQMRESGWYKQGRQEATQDFLNLINDKDLLEKLADLEHQQWSHLVNYLLSLGRNLDMKVHNKYYWLANANYKDLSERDKEKDRIWARKVLQELRIRLG